jgi:hypothetical protein
VENTKGWGIFRLGIVKQVEVLKDRFNESRLLHSNILGSIILSDPNAKVVLNVTLILKKKDLGKGGNKIINGIVLTGKDEAIIGVDGEDTVMSEI